MSQRQSKPTPSRRIDLLRRKVPSGYTPDAINAPHLIRYVADGHAAAAPTGVSVAAALSFAEAEPDRMAMFFYPAPTESAINELAEAWELHPVLVEDLIHARQRPKLERYGDVLFLVVRSARYIDEKEEVEFAEFHILVREGAIAVLCQDNRWIDGTDGTDFGAATGLTTSDRREQTLLDDEALLRLGPEAVMYRILDVIVDGYTPVLHGLAVDKEQIERQVFGGDASVTERIYRLSEEVIDMQHATSSLTDVLVALSDGFSKYNIPEELQTHLKDVSDHLTRAQAQILEYREALAQILTVNSTLVAQRQNEDMKKISGWAAILFAPTLVAAVYGMNFDVMPETHWPFGYPLAVVAMVAFAGLLYWVFKRRRWM